MSESELENGAEDAAVSGAELAVVPNDESGGVVVDDRDYPSTALVEIEEGLAVLFGDSTPEGMDLIPMTFVDIETRGALSTAIGSAVGLGNIAAQGVNAYAQAQGLVRLAPQTLEALKSAAPIVKDGWNLGTLASGGKFAAQVRWLPATAATTASVVAAMGPAITLMVIQAQLNEIAKVAAHNVELTSTVLQVVRQEEWSRVAGYYRAIIGELEHARRIGGVTDAVYGEVRGYQAVLNEDRDLFEKNIKRYVTELQSKAGHKERQQYLSDHGSAIVTDAQALLLAQTSWFVYQSLRAGHLLRTAESNPMDAELLKSVVANAQTVQQTTLDETEQLLDQLAREFAVIGELPGKRTIKIGGTARAAKDAKRIVRQLQAALASVRGREVLAEPGPLALPPIRVFEHEVPDELRRILPLRLQPDERVLALADASCDRWHLPGLGAGWVAVTDRRLLVTKQDSLRRVGAIDLEFDLEDVRYVRRHIHEGRAPIVDVIAKDADVSLNFQKWAKSGEQRTEAERLGELVASHMHVPASEVPVLSAPEPLAAIAGDSAS